MEEITQQELDAYLNGFFAAMDILKQQETATINATQNLINQL